MKTLKKLMVLAVITSSIALSACNKEDDVVNTNIVTKNGLAMTPAQENPAVTNSTATGTMDVSYNKTTKQLVYNVTWTGLTDTITGSHIHGTAKRGINTGVVVAFDVPNKAAKAGNYSGNFTVEGVKVKEDSLLKGFYYINIHTKKNPGGEIRGQIEF